MSLSVFAAGRDAPEAEALVLDGAIWTWRDMAQRVVAVSDALRVKIEDEGAETRVAFVAENRPAALWTLLALWELGWIAVPLHPRWTAAERAGFLARLEVRNVLGGGDLAQLESLQPTAAGMDDVPSPAPRDPESLAALVATSGSSGGPKAVALSRRAFVASARASAARLGWRDDDRWLLSLSLAHIGGLSVLTRCLEARKTLVMTPATKSHSASFDAGDTVGWAARHRVTLLSFVPTMLRRILDESLAPPASLRAVLLGGATSRVSLVEEGLAAGWPLWRTYGLTEACSQVATGRAAEGPGAPLLDGVEARTRDGVLEIRSQVLFSGYQPDGHVQPPDRWFRTGDLAKLEHRDEGTWLRILGRADEVIGTGGENVHPAEVEAALLEHPRVEAACVVGVPDERWGQAVAAAVVAEGVTASDLEEFLRQRLAGFRLPRRWRFVDRLPVNAVGKVDRRKISNLF